MQLQLGTIALFDSTIARKNQHKEITISLELIKIKRQLRKTSQEISKCQSQNANSFFSEFGKSSEMNREIFQILHRIRSSIFMKDSTQAMKRSKDKF